MSEANIFTVRFGTNQRFVRGESHLLRIGKIMKPRSFVLCYAQTMRYLGIDFGTKKVGLALSDEEGGMAFPLSVLEVTPSLFLDVFNIIKKEDVGAIVMGDSRDFQGEENPLMEKAHIFKDKLKKETGLPVHLEPEIFSSKEAGRIQGFENNIDSSAAAIVLQSFLDRQKN